MHQESYVDRKCISQSSSVSKSSGYNGNNNCSRAAVLAKVEDAFSGRRAGGEERVGAGLETEHRVAKLSSAQHVDVEVGRIVDLREELEHLTRLFESHVHARR